MRQNENDILTVKDVADHFKLAPSTVYRLAQNGELPAVKLGGNWRFSHSHLKSWFQIQSKQNFDDGEE